MRSPGGFTREDVFDLFILAGLFVSLMALALIFG